MVKRVLDSPRGGWRIFADCGVGWFVDFLFSLNKSFSLSFFTSFVKQHEVAKGGDDLRRGSQSEGFRHWDAKILEWLVRDNLYDKRFNKPETIVTCGNLMGLKMLVAEGYDPNYAGKYGTQPLSAPLCSKDMVDMLIKAGAKVELLNGRKLPSVNALRRMLQLRLTETKAKFTGEVSMRNKGVGLLPYVEFMREFNYPEPQLFGLADSHRFEAECALFA